jgi:hypothetical protein
VENNVEQACSWVAVADMMLQKTLAVIGWDILHPIWVSLKKKKVYLSSYGSLWVALYPLASASAVPGLGLC